MKLKLNDGSSGNANTLHHALGPFLVLSQFFGILPVSGVWPTSSVAQVNFRWCSLSVVVTLVLSSFAVIDFFLSAKVVMEHGLGLRTAGPLSFNIICLAGFLVFLLLSRNWPNLIKQTRRCEIVFLHKSYSSNDTKRFSCRLRTLGTILLLGAVVEHLCYVSSVMYSNHLRIKDCNLTVDFWENYFMRERLHIFSIICYNVWWIPLVEWITIADTFTWNFVDIFLIIVCRGIAVRFNQMHWRIARHAKEQMPNEFWQEVRRDFLALTDLLWQCDDKLSSLMLLSCVHNLYFICVQIFHSFQGYKGNFMNEIYFWFSLIFVLTRILTMMFSAASVHDAANNISAAMYEIPTAYWSLELKRLNEVIVNDSIALSGKGFFFLTRKLIFGMAGTIVVYELVMMDQVDAAESQTAYCD